MQFTSLKFLLFMLITAAVEFLLPKIARTKWLFAASIVFYALLDIKFVPLLAAVVLTAYLGGLAVKTENGKGRNAGFAAAVITEIALLVIFRSAGIFTKDHVWIVPVGISFYILQAIGYLADVRRGAADAEKDLVDLGLFISFFPQLTSGPIERAPHMLPQFKKGPDGFDPVRIRDGALFMLWGYFMKMVIADRIAILTDTFYSAPGSYGGAVAFTAAALYMIQLYCDFAGYSSIAIGAAKVLGIELFENFNSPFLSGSVAEYWHRWHISLSTWLRDYIYIPLGGSRKGTGRKYINILLTFLVSGLWHGTGWNFLLWGLVFGLLQIAGSILIPV
ncbi:MAG: MBOAT family protein, partial [Lachnospiraceae bacterium]|nr:MBOAT family protein [Lachnospiraceae bacterium]